MICNLPVIIVLRTKAKLHITASSTLQHRTLNRRQSALHAVEPSQVSQNSCTLLIDSRTLIQHGDPVRSSTSLRSHACRSKAPLPSTSTQILTNPPDVRHLRSGPLENQTHAERREKSTAYNRSMGSPECASPNGAARILAYTIWQ